MQRSLSASQPITHKRHLGTVLELGIWSVFLYSLFCLHFALILPTLCVDYVPLCWLCSICDHTDKCMILIFVGIDTSQHLSISSKTFMASLSRASMWHIYWFLYCCWLILKGRSFCSYHFGIFDVNSKIGCFTCHHDQDHDHDSGHLIILLLLESSLCSLFMRSLISESLLSWLCG